MATDKKEYTSGKKTRKNSKVTRFQISRSCLAGLFSV